MVKAKQDRRHKDIKSKLMAAIAMLLVSSIMMVSSTYAWFTLSTAPEVTGISTAIGANGNLEIALLPTSGDVSDITSGTSDSMASQAVHLANVTWGNLVDLSDNGNVTYYGLNKITLYPSKLNTTTKDEQGNITGLNSVTFLSTPQYGYDGRVSSLADNTFANIYDTDKNVFPKPSNTTQYGVRAIGAASGMTAEELAYRSARAAASTAMKAAQTQAGQSLNNRGSSLASIAVNKAAGKENYTVSHLESMRGIINDLNDADGVMNQLDTAYLQYLYAMTISNAVDPTGALFTQATTWLEDAQAATQTAMTPMNYFKDKITTGVTVNGTTYKVDLTEERFTALNEALTALETTKAAVTNADTELKKLEDKVTDENKSTITFTWAEVYNVLKYLADPDEMLVCGYTVAEVKADMNLLLNNMGSGIVVTMASGGGVYADVADHCGDYDAFVKLENVEFSGINLNTTVTMNTKASHSYLPSLGTAVLALGAPAAGGNDLPLSDFYGYIIDLAFRTNAANSNLLLQTAAVDRIYEGTYGVEDEQKGTTTMGGGSTMSFTVADATLSISAIESLMSSIRVVFFNPTDFSVYAVAGLDTEALPETVATRYELPLYLYENQAESTTTYTAATGYSAAVATTDGTKSVTVTKDDQTVTDVVLYIPEKGDNPSTEETETNYITGYTALADAADGDYSELYTASTTSGDPQKTKLTGNNAVITALTQNTAQKVSVLVYLDGESITNASVAATAASSMSGTLNLQFSSSANLVPMEYADLKGQAISTGGTNSSTTSSNTTTSSTPAEGGDQAGA